MPSPTGTRSQQGEAESHAGKGRQPLQTMMGKGGTTTACYRLSQTMAKVM
jgi:hypothetical protein